MSELTVGIGLNAAARTSNGDVHADLQRLTRARGEFMIVDLVLKDTLLDYARGGADEEEFLFALQREREAHEEYLRRMYEFLARRRPNDAGLSVVKHRHVRCGTAHTMPA